MLIIKFIALAYTTCKKVFTKNIINISKVMIIWSVSFIFRYLINKYLGINVFIEYSNWISIIFYLGFAIFIVFINEFFSFYKTNTIFNFSLFSTIKSKIRKIYWLGLAFAGIVVVIIITTIVWLNS